MAIDAWGLEIRPRSSEPHTSFQTPTGYRADNDIRTDAVIFYRPFETEHASREAASWIDKGYVLQTMYGFRAKGPYIKDHMDEGQTDEKGRVLIPQQGSYYMVPTQDRIGIALRYVRDAIASGAGGICAEEPEFFARAGYSEAFKREWLDYYGEPWLDPASSIEARWKSERLKGYLKRRIVNAMLEETHKIDPDVVGMVACHSPLSYCAWGIICPHYELMRLPDLAEIIAQVWTGTARTPCRYEGVWAERTFEFAYLEYSAFSNLVRGTGKRLWFLMDPLEDNPDRTMEDYQSNYEKTLVAALMSPEVDSYEVMPWPTRIYGHVPDEFATRIGTVVNVLGDIHNQTAWQLDSGTQGIATFVADSMAWQRARPHKSSFEDFYGLTLPLLMRGIPVQVAQLERVTEPGYLDPYRVLLLSYDMMKPVNAAINESLARWVDSGGVLVLVGGSDAYNGLPEWWQEEGFRSPQDHLLAEMGIGAADSVSRVLETQFVTLLTADAPFSAPDEETPRTLDLTYVLHLEKHKDLPNRGVYTVDLSDHVLPDASVFVRFENADKEEGWAPLVYRVDLVVDGRVAESFVPGSDAEREHLVLDGGSQIEGGARIADADAYWVYGFHAPAGSRVQLVVDMANLFQVSAATISLAGTHVLRRTERGDEGGGSDMGGILTSRIPEIHISVVYPVTAYDVDAEPLYTLDGEGRTPLFEKSVGSGIVVFVGIASRFFASSVEAADILRSIVAHACERVGAEYREQGHFTIRRGRYVAVRSLDSEVTLQGEYVDVLDPGFTLHTDPVVPPGGLALMADVAGLLSNPTPRLLLSSDRVEASRESPESTTLRLSGPLGTKGVARISTAGRRMSSFAARDAYSAPVDAEVRDEGRTLFARYDASPEGILLTIGW
jgi:hypothetical protein